MNLHDMLSHIAERTNLSEREALILQMLISRPEMYGLEMVEASDGELKRGTVYVTLNRLEEKGYIESRHEERQPGAIGLPRRLYKVTGLGERALNEWGRIVAQLRPILAGGPA